MILAVDVFVVAWKLGNLVCLEFLLGLEYRDVR